MLTPVHGLVGGDLGFFITGSLLLGVLGVLCVARQIRLSIVAPDFTTFVTWTLTAFWGAVVWYGYDQAGFYQVSGDIFPGRIYRPQFPGRFLTVTIVSGVALLVSISVARLVAADTPERWARWYRAPTRITHISEYFDRHFWKIVAGASAVFAGYIAYIGGPGGLPLIVLLSGGSYMDVVLSRELAFKGFPLPLAYLFHGLRVLVFPILVLYSYATLRLEPSSARRWFRFIFIALLGGFFNAASTAIGPVAEMLLSVLFIELVFQRLDYKRGLAVYGLGFVALFGVLYGLLMLWPNIPTRFWEYAGSLMAERILLRGHELVANVAVFTNAYPTDEGPLGLAGIAKAAQILGIERHHINNELFLFLKPLHPVTTGNYNGPWFLYGYANFSYLGAMGTSALLGVTLVTLNRFFRSLPKDPLVIAFFALTMTATLSIFDSPFMSWLISQGGVVGAATCFLLVRLATAARSTPPAARAASLAPLADGSSA